MKTKAGALQSVSVIIKLPSPEIKCLFRKDLEDWCFLYHQSRHPIMCQDFYFLSLRCPNRAAILHH